MALPDSFIQELIARNDVESVISSYVPLRRRGRNLVGLCPFHGEKTASFTVYPETTSFYCFGCHVGGDVITFIKQIENLEYMDAVRFLADRAGMKMPENSTENEQTTRMRMRILEINREAARLFHQVLYRPEGKKALDYYHSRGYSDSTIRHFGLGYAPDSWDFLFKALRAKGYYPEELEAAYLCKRGQKGGYYDLYRGRVIIPIIDVRGAVVGFGGRVLDDTKPKYINTQDTLVYNKRRELFGLNFAKNTGKELNICEGYMDAIAMHQAGFTNTVASLGTAFPDEQIRLIARYADRVNLIFDADLAGQEATQRAITNLRKTGLDVRVVSIPDGKDPDEYILKNGPEAFRRVLDGSANAVEYRLLKIGEQHDVRSSNGKIAYFKDAAKVLAELESPVERDVYAGRLSELLSISKDAILHEVNGIRRGRQKAQVKQHLPNLMRQETTEMRQVNPEATAHPRAANAEESLLGTLMLHPDYCKQVAPILPPEKVVTAFNRELYTRLLERYRQGLMLELSFLSAYYDELQMAYITRMVKDAKERVLTAEDAVSFATIIRDEHALKGMADPAAASDDEILKMMETLRARKKK